MEPAVGDIDTHYTTHGTPRHMAHGTWHSMTQCTGHRAQGTDYTGHMTQGTGHMALHDTWHYTTHGTGHRAQTTHGTWNVAVCAQWEVRAARLLARMAQTAGSGTRVVWKGEQAVRGGMGRQGSQ